MARGEHDVAPCSQRNLKDGNVTDEQTMIQPVLSTQAGQRAIAKSRFSRTRTRSVSGQPKMAESRRSKVVIIITHQLTATPARYGLISPVEVYISA